MGNVKFLFNVWKDKIVPRLSKMHGARWAGFDSEEMVKAMLFRSVYTEMSRLSSPIHMS